MTTVKEFGYNQTLKEITEQLKEQKEFLMGYLEEQNKAYSDYELNKISIEIEERYNGIVSHIAEIVSIEFKENVFYNENKK